MTNTTLRTLALASLFALGACDVGNVKLMPSDDTPGADGGMAATWEEATGSDPAMTGFDLADDGTMYAVIEDEVKKWDGLIWLSVTDEVPGLSAAIHVEAEDAIYAVIGTKVCKWDGVAWLDVTADAIGLQPTLHYLADDMIYSVIGTKVCMWNGLEWQDITGDTPGLAPVVAVSPAGEIYGIIGGKVCKWLGEWQDLTGTVPGIAPALQMYGDSPYAIVGSQIGRWNQRTWELITPAGSPLRPQFQVAADGSIVAMLGQSLSIYQ